ncbi:VOC family protein [Paenibacillus sp. GCM10023252]|uniref:VOC family protein n=1 Tax=Paenibacillus sp. GCM10023252 TaxID=3252649 RepID=UPI0036137353
MNNFGENSVIEKNLEDITGVTCIYVPVRDVFTSVQWYRRNLGCEPTIHYSVEPGMTRAIMRFPDINGVLAEPGIRQVVPALILMRAIESAGELGFVLDDGIRHPSFCFIAPNFYEIFNRFKENGVHILTESIEGKPNGPYVSFTDPDGNVLAIWQPL